MGPDAIPVRPARPADVGQLIGMMRSLAQFEGYLDFFRVCAEDLLDRAFGPRAQCSIVVVDGEHGMLAGYAVYLVQPFTYDLRPSVILKELFVDANHRGRGVAAALLERVRQDALGLGAGRILWLVLPSNESAKRLYRRLGGSVDTYWEHWQLVLVDETGAV